MHTVLKYAGYMRAKVWYMTLYKHTINSLSGSYIYTTCGIIFIGKIYASLLTNCLGLIFHTLACYCSLLEYKYGRSLTTVYIREYADTKDSHVLPVPFQNAREMPAGRISLQHFTAWGYFVRHNQVCYIATWPCLCCTVASCQTAGQGRASPFSPLYKLAWLNACTCQHGGACQVQLVHYYDVRPGRKSTLYPNWAGLRSLSYHTHSLQVGPTTLDGAIIVR